MSQVPQSPRPNPKKSARPAFGQLLQTVSQSVKTVGVMLRPSAIQGLRGTINLLQAAAVQLEAQETIMAQALPQVARPTLDWRPVQQLAQRFWRLTQPLWVQVVGWVRGRLPAETRGQLSDRALSGWLGAAAVLLFWLVSALPGGGAVAKQPPAAQPLAQSRPRRLPRTADNPPGIPKMPATLSSPLSQSKNRPMRSEPSDAIGQPSVPAPGASTENMAPQPLVMKPFQPTPMIKPGIRPEIEPAIKPETKSAIKPETTPGAKSLGGAPNQPNPTGSELPVLVKPAADRVKSTAGLVKSIGPAESPLVLSVPLSPLAQASPVLTAPTPAPVPTSVPTPGPVPRPVPPAPKPLTPPLTPEQRLLADVQTAVQTLAPTQASAELASFSPELAQSVVQSMQVNLQKRRLAVTLSEAWYGLSTGQQNRLATVLLDRAQGGSLILRDRQGSVLARSPVVGSEMVILRRVALAP